MAEFDIAGTAQACRNGDRQLVSQGLLMRMQLIESQAGMQRAHTAGDVEADATGRDHPSLVRIERRHAADRKAIAPMCIRHGVSGLLYAGQGGDIADLFKYLLIHGLDQFLISIDDRRHPHFPLRLD